MLRRIFIGLTIVASVVLTNSADAQERRHPVDATPFAHAPCSVLSGEPCTPSFCSVFNGGPCIPEIDYPIGQNLQLTIQSVPPRDDAAKYQKPDHDLDTIGDLFAALRSCWSPPPADDAREGMQMSVLFSFKRSGEIIAAPRVTYSTREAPQQTPRPLSQGDISVAGRLRAVEIHRRPRRRAGGPPDHDPLCRQPRPGEAVGEAVACPGRSAARSTCGAVRCRAGAQLVCLTGVPVLRSSTSCCIAPGTRDHSSLNTCRTKSVTATRAACVAAALPPTCGLSCTHSSL